MRFCGLFIFLFSFSTFVFGQQEVSANFRSVVDARLKNVYGAKLITICPVDTDIVAKRIFLDYGAIFISNNGGILPTSCVFDNEQTVRAFQSGVPSRTEKIGSVTITLQKSAMDALIAARADAAKVRLSITPRGGSAAASRSYTKTADLWQSRFLPGLRYWTAKGRISKGDAEKARTASVGKQVEMVLEWEQRGIYFSTDMSKSILYSVAAPGASQHIFMLALDVQQFGDRRVREILENHGWFQTVKSDAPHFTFLGVKRSELPALGLRKEVVGGQDFWIPNM